MNYKEYEKKWQKIWEDNKFYYTDLTDSAKKYFVLDMFPFPSGKGLHVGHVEGYTGTDIVTRFKKMQGYNVLHPMGWDAFGLPAEQYAIETGRNPREFIDANIETFRKQLLSSGLVYNWDCEVKTADPNYYKWTQWIFNRLYEKGLAEVKEVEVNWCEKLLTVLSNEEVLNKDGVMVSERGGHPVAKKPMKQWVLKITHYAERLLEDLDLIDWPHSIKEMQRNWIGRSEGASIKFKSEEHKTDLEVFTTRPDTIYGASYLVIAPEHELVSKFTTEKYESAVNEYINIATSKTDLERTELNKNKTGVFTGSYVTNQISGEKIPVWISDYVLINYGTGIVMAVPAHDERDYEFAKKYDLPIKQVIEGDISSEAFTGDGIHFDSEIINGMNNEDAIKTICDFIEEKGYGSRQINYKLRDWIFARQRYWGEPFPVIYYDDGTVEIIEDLPVELPVLDKILPSGTGESPLANAKEWLEVVSKDGVRGVRDTNTMPNWAGSCWYYIGYLLKQTDGTYLNPESEEAHSILNNWLPVDLYIGGSEHAVLHLLYARFWHKVLYDIGVLTTKEPFQKLYNQGMILGEDNDKMSKSKGNIVLPDEIIEEYGADTLRMYLMFMGPLDASKPWNSTSVGGMKKYIDRVIRFFDEVAEFSKVDDLDFAYNKLVKDVTNDYESIKFNTVISSLMTFTNEIYKAKKITKEHALGFIKCLFPIAPHICEEINEKYNLSDNSLAVSEFPVYDDSKLVVDEKELAIQVNGKLRGQIVVSVDATDEEITKQALAVENVRNHIADKEIIKTIVVKKLVNFVVK